MRRVLDEENRRNETWRDGRLERLFTRVEILEDGMGLSARMLTGQDRAFPGSTGGGMAFWDVQGERAPVEGDRRVTCMSRVIRSGLVPVIPAPGLCAVSDDASFM